MGEDKDGNLWIGTDKGLCRTSCFRSRTGLAIRWRTFSIRLRMERGVEEESEAGKGAELDRAEAPG